MPAPAGWRRAAVPQEACRFRDPLWLRPVARLGEDPLMDLFPGQEPDVQLVGLQARPGGTGEVVVSLQNLGPVRRHVRLGAHWEVVGQVDGLHEPLPALGNLSANKRSAQKGATENLLAPWSLSFWILRRRQSS